MSPHSETNAWVDRARALRPVIEEERDAGETQRRMPDATFTALQGAGLFRLSLPRRLGGEAAATSTQIAVIEEMSSQDGAVGWNLMIGLHLGYFAAGLPEEGAREVYADPDRPGAGSFAPVGTVTAGPEGYRVTGRWPFASNCHHAHWLAATGVVRGEGASERRVVFLPAGECRVIDTWHTTGLRGTGSHDFEVTQALVPAYRSLAVQPAGGTWPGQLSMRWFLSQAGPTLAAVGLGIARDAIESLKSLAGGKVPTRGTSPLAAQHTTQERVGHAEALVRSARAFLMEAVRELEPVLAAGAEPDERLATLLRLASSHAARSAAEAVDLMFTAGGGTSVYATSRLDRCFRDVHMVTQHIAVAPSNVEMAGQYLLGLGFQERR